LLLLAMSFASRAEDRRLAVLEMRGKGLDAQALGLLSESARAGALQAVRGKGVSVVTRENLMLLLKSAGVAPEDCEGECEVETGRRIGADFVVTGDAVRLEDRFVVSLKLHETGHEFRLRVTEDYGALLDEMNSGLIDIAKFSPYGYVLAKKTSGVHIFATELTYGRPWYRGYIIARKDRHLTSIEDLRGKS